MLNKYKYVTTYHFLNAHYTYTHIPSQAVDKIISVR